MARHAHLSWPTSPHGRGGGLRTSPELLFWQHPCTYKKPQFVTHARANPPLAQPFNPPITLRDPNSLVTVDNLLMKSRQRGLTLVELLTALSILAVLTALAAPSVNNWRTGARLTVYSNELETSLAYAKSEALQRGIRVTMCKSSNPTASNPACATTGSWTQGWVVFADNVQIAGNVAGVIDGDDTVLKIGAALPEVAITATNFTNWISYLPTGLTRVNSGPPSGSFNLCMPNNNGTQIVVNSVGRTRSARATCP